MSTFSAALIVGLTSACASYSICHTLHQHVLKHSTIQGKLVVRPGEVVRTMINAFIGPFLAVFFGVHHHLTVDWGWPTTSTARCRDFLLTWIVMHFWYETMEFWQHFMMHKVPFLYSRVHYIHHQSKDTTVFSAMSFHPLEFLALQIGAFGPLFVVQHVVNVNVYALMLASLQTFFRNLYTHSGLLDKDHPHQDNINLELLRVILFCAESADFHDVHHHTNKSNYGFSWAFWDKVMGTYLERFDGEITT